MFEVFLEEMRKRVSQIEYDRYIKNLKLKEARNNRFVIETKNKIFQKWIKTNYLPHIREILKISGYENADIIIETKENIENKHSNINPTANLTKELGLSRFLTFNSFVVGKASDFAYNCAKLVANDTKNQYNPLLIYGNTGLGKTHLLNAIGNKVFSRGITITYISAENMMNEYTLSIKSNTMDSFKNKYRNCDYLLVDDIQFLANKTQLQEEFFNTFESLVRNSKHIVLTSDRDPKDIKDIDDRLKSRFASGLSADIHPPELETRIEIIKKKCEIDDIKIKEELIELIAINIHNDMRAIEGVLSNLRVYKAMDMDMIINESLIKDIIKNQMRDINKRINIDTITKVVSNEYNIKIGDLKSNSKNQKIAQARRVIFYLAKNLTTETTSYLAQYFKMKDHSSVSKALNKVKSEIKNDNLFKIKIDEMEIKIKQKTSE